MTSATAFAFLVEKARSSIFEIPASVMPGRNGVTAPITPASRTTGTTAAPGRHRAGRNCLSRSIDHGAGRRLSISLITFPSACRKIYQFLFLSHHFHRSPLERHLHCGVGELQCGGD